MTKTAAVYVLHYGKEWLYWSLRSLVDFVDAVYIFYASVPSFGYNTKLSNPDSRTELYDIAASYVPRYNFHWVDVAGVHSEGQHRDFAINRLKDDGVDIAVLADADEVYTPDTLQTILNTVPLFQERNYLIGMRHFWRSTKWVCDDGCWPVRIIKPQVAGDGNYVRYLNDDTYGKMFHFGYAQKPELISYKQSITPHLPEWRTNWYTDKFLKWRPGCGMTDVHPTGVPWTPTLYKDDGMLEYLIGDHPYWGLDIIE